MTFRERLVHIRDIQPIVDVTRELRRRFGRVVEHVYPKEETKISLLRTGRESLKMEEALLRTAKHHAYIKTYTFDDDVVSQSFLQTFQNATKENQHVEYGLLVDHIMAVRKAKEAVYHTLTQLNSNGRIHVAVTNYFHVLGIFEQNPFHRDHKKIATADGKRALITTANIGEHHTRWKDAGILFEGPVAQVIEKDVANTFANAKRWKRVYESTDIFDYIDRYGFIPKGKDLLGAIVRNPQERGKRVVIHSSSGDITEVLTDSFYRPYQEATNAAFQMMKHAKKGATVDIFTPYQGMYTLTNEMIDTAMRSGVTINLFIPSNNDHPLYNPNALPKLLKPIGKTLYASWKKRLESAGIHVYEFVGDKESGGMLHMKAINVTNPDDSGELLFGSSNFNRGLFAGTNREIAVKLTNQSIRKEFSELTDEIRSQSRKLF